MFKALYRPNKLGEKVHQGPSYVLFLLFPLQSLILCLYISVLSKYFKIGFVVPAWEHLPSIKPSYLQVHSRFLFLDKRHEYLINEQQCP